MKKFFVCAFILVTTIGSLSSADCMDDDFGNVYCSKEGNGAIIKNNFNQFVCGPGQCITDEFSRIQCSTIPGGIVFKDNFNQWFSAPGACVKDNFEQYLCSAMEGGQAVQTSSGQYSCDGGCVKPVKGSVEASQDQCYKMSQSSNAVRGSNFHRIFHKSSLEKVFAKDLGH